MLRAVQQVKINVDYRLSKVSDISDSLILNEEFIHILASNPVASLGFDQVEEQRTLSNTIRSFEGKDILNIKIYVLESKMYANENVYFFNLGESDQQPWYSDVIEKGGGVHWIPTRLQNHDSTASSVQVLSLARMIRDPKQFGRIIGIMELQVLEDNFSFILNNADFSSENDTMYIVDSNGTIVSHYNSDRINEPLLEPAQYAEILNQKTGIHKVEIESKPYFVIYDTLEETGWKIISLVPVQAINQMYLESNFASSIVLILSFLLLFILAAFLVFAYVMEGMVERLRQMTTRLRLRGTETIDEGIPKRRGVVIRLEKSVTHMLSTFQHLMEENYQTKMKEREAQLRALQSQINPHFLYNALDTINWMALTRGAQDISQMLNTLAQYFRLTLNKGKDIVTVEDEMNLAKAYLDIQKHRFHSFEYVVEIDDTITSRPIPKLTVQPLIENAILHGIQNKEGHQGHITIRVLPTASGFTITVTDDGIGLSEVQITDIMSGLYSKSPTSYGLFNVLERVRLFTENRGRIDIESIVGEGTTVTISIE